MKALIKVEKEFDIRYLKVEAHVRYWEDSEINGEPDVDIDEHEDEKPRMPFSSYEEVGFNKHEWLWKPIIDVDNGMILNWPNDIEADIHYKVCDEGVYTLLDNDFCRILQVESYVPKCLYPGDDGYGDYIIMHINKDGSIDNFSFTQDDVDEIIKNDFNYERE